MIIIILQIWVKIVIFLTKCFISQNHLSFTETGVMDTGNSLWKFELDPNIFLDLQIFEV